MGADPWVAMTSLDFTHSGPHDALISDERRRSRLAVAAGRIARTTALAVVALALIALRYWIYLPHFLHPAG
jgi:hypothetical protein